MSKANYAVAFSKPTTQYAARKGSSFMYFVFNRLTRETGTLTGYTTDRRAMIVNIDRAQLRCFLQAELRLRGKVFGEMYKSSKGRTLKLQPYMAAEVLMGTRAKQIVLPARKLSKNFQSFTYSKSDNTLTGNMKDGRKVVVVAYETQLSQFLAVPVSRRGSAFAALVHKSWN